MKYYRRCDIPEHLITFFEGCDDGVGFKNVHPT